MPQASATGRCAWRRRGPEQASAQAVARRAAGSQWRMRTTKSPRAVCLGLEGQTNTGPTLDGVISDIDSNMGTCPRGIEPTRPTG